MNEAEIQLATQAGMEQRKQRAGLAAPLPPLYYIPHITIGPSSATASIGSNADWTITYAGTAKFSPPPPHVEPSQPTVRPPGPDYQPLNVGSVHVEQSSPSINPLAALGRLISGVNVPPVLVGMARGVIAAAGVAALEAIGVDLKGAHLPVEYAAIVPLALLVFRSIEGGLDQWGKGG